MDASEHALRMGRLLGIHAAYRRIPAEQQRRHSELRTDALRGDMQVVAKRQTEKELGYAHAAGAGREKMPALVNDDDDADGE